MVEPGFRTPGAGTVALVADEAGAIGEVLDIVGRTLRHARRLGRAP